jgi:hypothetical protein
MNNNTVLRVTASDNYTQTLSYNMVNGAFTTYNVTNGKPVQHYQSLTPILAYYLNDSNLTTDEGGPLRLAIVGPEGLATYSSYWVKWVIKLEIRHIDDVAVTTAAPLRPAVGQGFSCNVNVTLANHGGYNETLTVKAYANQTTIGEHTITIPIGNSTTITFAWNTTGFARGNYTISANVTLASGETNSWTGPFKYGTVLITKVGDLGGGVPPQFFKFDGVIDGKDLALFLECYHGTAPSEAMYLADLGGGIPPQFFKCDGKVDGKDLALFLLCYHGSGP